MTEGVNKTLETISEFLGEERIEKLKDYVLQSLMDNLQESIEQHYVVFPSDFDEMWESLFDDCKKEIKKKYKKDITDAMSERIDKWIKEEKL